jgi:hypothetical protein
MTTKEFIKSPVEAINKLSTDEIKVALKDMEITDIKKLTSLKFSLWKDDSDVFISELVHNVVKDCVSAFLKTTTLRQVVDNDLFYSLIGRCGEFFAFSKNVAVDISYRNINGNGSTCCVQVCSFKDGVLMITHGWDAARPRFGKLLHKENEYYFSKVDFVDRKKFTKVEKPFGFIK